MKQIEKENGDVKIFAGGKTAVNAFESDIKNANITKEISIIVQSRGVIDFIFYDKPFTFKNEMWAYTHKNKVFLKFIYYYLKNNLQYFRNASLQMGSLPQISLKVTENFKIPIPPLEKQKEIVEILDQFDKICNDLTAGLPYEIELRKKQYEYYRDALLSF